MEDKISYLNIKRKLGQKLYIDNQKFTVKLWQMLEDYIIIKLNSVEQKVYSGKEFQINKDIKIKYINSSWTTGLAIIQIIAPRSISIVRAEKWARIMEESA